MVEQRSKHRQDDNIKMNLRKISCEDVKKLNWLRTESNCRLLQTWRLTFKFKRKYFHQLRLLKEDPPATLNYLDGAVSLLRSQYVEINQPVRKFPVFCGSWMFITVFTKACHPTLHWAKWIHPVSLRSILILFPMYMWFIQAVSSLQVFWPKFCMPSSSLPCVLQSLSF
jgi:hypothetical protein